ncbi:hypothetical protein AB4Z09_18210 [Rhodococcus sp. TAF43]|uniref:hypothetical protein n=1 Tax=Rhodococcus sp. TAF43 TaxID=3237483 RepID=UPI003F998A0E
MGVLVAVEAAEVVGVGELGKQLAGLLLDVVGVLVRDLDSAGLGARGALLDWQGQSNTSLSR